MSAIIADIVIAPVLRAVIVQCIGRVKVVPGLPVIEFMPFIGEFDLAFEEKIGIGDRSFGKDPCTGSYHIEELQCFRIGGRRIISQDRICIDQVDVRQTQHIGADILILLAAQSSIVGRRTDDIFLYISMVIRSLVLRRTAGRIDAGAVEQSRIHMPSARILGDIQVNIVGHEESGPSADGVSLVGGIHIVGQQAGRSPERSAPAIGGLGDQVAISQVGL